jgi:tetratricopeptide (TPR) repeat protein
MPVLDIQSSLLVLQSYCSIEQTAEKLFARESCCTHSEALIREKAALEGICNDLNQRLPITLTLIAAYVDQRKMTFEECRSRLEADSIKVYERAEVAYSIHDAFSISRNELTPDALSVLAAAACFARKNVSQSLLREVSLIDSEEAFEDAVALLDRATLIDVDNSGRVTIHDLFRDMTLKHIDAADRDLVLDRTAEALARSLSRANVSMVWDDVRWEIIQSRAVAATCRLHRRHGPLAALLFELGHYYRLRDQIGAAVAHLDEAARVVTAFLPESTHLLAKCKMQISATEPGKLEAIRQARLALTIARLDTICSPAEMSEFYNAMGYALKMNGKRMRALPYYCRALQLCDSELSRCNYRAAEYLNNISALYEDTGDYAKALDYVKEANDIFMQLYGSTNPLYAFSLNTLGRIQRCIGESEKALASHSSARGVFLKLSGIETKNYAMSLYFEGAALADLGSSEVALQRARSALDILERVYGVEDLAARRVRSTVNTGVFK